MSNTAEQNLEAAKEALRLAEEAAREERVENERKEREERNRVRLEEHREARRKEKEEEMKLWIKLCDDLNAEHAVGYPYEVQDTEHTTRIIRADGEHLTKIYRETIYGARWGSDGHALRIATDDRRVSAGKLKRDFGSKNVAKHLNKKCTELLDIVKAKSNAKNKATAAAERLTNAIKRDFPNVTPSRDINRYSDTIQYNGVISFTYENVKVRTLEDGVYNGTANVHGLTAGQVQELNHLLQSFKDEQ